MKSSLLFRGSLLTALCAFLLACPTTPPGGNDAGTTKPKDGGTPDSGTPDSGTPDSGTPTDGGLPDSGTPPGPDTTPPAAVTDLAVTAHTSTSTTLGWTASGDDGDTGTASSYDLRYATGAACPLTAASFATGTPVSLFAPQAAGSHESVTVAGLTASTSYCFALIVKDEVDNASDLSNVATTSTDADSTPPPPAVTGLTAGSETNFSVVLSFTTGTPGTGQGPADHFQVGYKAAADCTGITDFTGVTQVSTGVPAPVAGSAQSVTVKGLAANTTYCFLVEEVNAGGSASALATVADATLTASSSSADIAAVRAAIQAGTATPITLSNLTITNATVSYVKTPGGTGVDGNGFFLQTDSGGPAIYVAIDPATLFGALSPALAAGDQVTLTATQGAWLNCSGTCKTDNSLYAITAATGTRVSSLGGTVPPPVSVNSTSIAPPAANFPLESVLVSGLVNITGNFSASGSYATATATTNKNTSGLNIRLPVALVSSVGASDGCTVRLNGSPLFRFGSTSELSAWTAADITLVTCPTPSLSASYPGTYSSTNLTTNLPLTLAPAIIFDIPMDTTTLVPSAAGACTGTVQLTTAADPTTCIALPTFTGDTFNQGFAASSTITLTANTDYVLKLTNGIKAVNGNAFAGQSIAFTTAANDNACRGVVISQVYGGGGNSGAPYTNDYVELQNNTTSSVSLTGCTIQYAPSSTSSWQVTVLNGVTLAAGQYYLVQEAAGANTFADLPVAPDQTGSINMSATTGTVALSSSLSAYPGTPSANACPATSGASSLVDLVGFGTASCKVTADAPAPSNTSGVLRKYNTSCASKSTNAADYSVNALPGGTLPHDMASTFGPVCTNG